MRGMKSILVFLSVVVPMSVVGCNSLFFNQQPMTITTVRLPAGYLGSPYVHTALTAAGGSGAAANYTWSLAAGTSLPQGLHLSSAGAISGTPTGSNTGEVSFEVIVTDTAARISSSLTSLSIVIGPGVTIVQSALLPPGNAGVAYSQVLTASGGSGVEYAWTAVNNTLPSCNLALTSNPDGTATISGAQPTACTASVTANVRDSVGNKASQAFSVTIYSALALPAVNSLPTGYPGTRYSAALVPTGGSGGYCFSASGMPTSANSSMDGLSGPNANVVNAKCSYQGPAFAIGGTPTNSPAAPYTVPFALTVYDIATNNSVSQQYAIAVNAPTYSLPSLNLAAATVGQNYNASIAAVIVGGSGSYSWRIDNTPIASDGSATALGSSGLAAEFFASNTGSGILTLSTAAATPPGTTGNVEFTAQVTDTVTKLSSAPQSYTIDVYPGSGAISGRVSLVNSCLSGSQPFSFDVSAAFNSTISTATSDSSGNFRIANLPFGTYTVTARVTGTTSAGPSQVYSPANYNNVVLSPANAAASENFSAAVAFSISGRVSYSGTQTAGQTYLYLTPSNCGAGYNGSPGTSIAAATVASGGAFTIHGVSPGYYTLNAWMDSTPNPAGPQGALNVNDPVPTSVSGVEVTNADVSNLSVALEDPAYAAPSANPAIQVFPINGGWLINYAPPVIGRNGLMQEDANAYALRWAPSTTDDSSGPTCPLDAGADGQLVNGVSHTFPASGLNQTLWIVNNSTMGNNNSKNSSSPFVSGVPYCFQVRAYNTLASAEQHPAGWFTYTYSGDGARDPKAVAAGTSNAPCTSNCTSVTAEVDIPSGLMLTGPLYMGFYQVGAPDGGPQQIYATQIASPGTTNAQTFILPNGAGYVLFGILDQNNDGIVDMGDVTNVRSNNSAGVTFPGSSTNPILELPSINSRAFAPTMYSACDASAQCSPYSLYFVVAPGNKLPVSAQLTSQVTKSGAPNVLTPVDLGNCPICTEFDYSAILAGGAPSVGDTYNFVVTYSDGTNDTVSAEVVGWNGDPTTVAGPSVGPSGLTVSSLSLGQPTFSWTDSSRSMLGIDSYWFSIYQSDGVCPTSGCTVWAIPAQNSGANGFPYSINSISWGTDPTSVTNQPNIPRLTSGATYTWQVEVQDPIGNQVKNSSSFTVP